MTRKSILLGVNIDHVATLRQTRLSRYPDPLEAVYAAESGGADGITVHLREDRRHIQERDVLLIKEVLLTRLNLEMAVTEAMLTFAAKIKPAYCCFVPEKRAELTTEGGLDVQAQRDKISSAIAQLKDQEVEVSLFIDPDPAQIHAAAQAGAPVIEIHTGAYANAHGAVQKKIELDRISAGAKIADDLGLIVNAGHGLNYQNVMEIASIPQMNELNIGHGIIARSIFIGLRQAVAEMKWIMMRARDGIA